MPRFSSKSKERLASCDLRLQQIMNIVIEHYDITVIEGHRSVERQQELYAQGRTKPGRIVTYLDGVWRKGNHNYQPSRAIDIAPWIPSAGGIDWNDIAEFQRMAVIVKVAAQALGVPITWGGDWNGLKDYPHFELRGA